MEGDRADLKALVELKEKWGAWLLVDEAHAFGSLGSHGQGLIDSAQLSEGVEIQLGTLGKAVGSMGGFVAASANTIQLLRQRARSFLFTTAPPVPAVAAALKGVRLIQSAEGAKRRQKLARLVGHCHHQAPSGVPVLSQIIPLTVYEENKVLQLSKTLGLQGIYVPAIRFPTVPLGSARLRISINALLNESDLDRLFSALREVCPEMDGDLKPA